jgi:hypothetical protein
MAKVSAHDRDPAMARAGEAARLITVLAVAAVAIAVAGFGLHDYVLAPDGLWSDAHHDRSGHLFAGQQMALAFRGVDLPLFIDALERAKVWPPLNDIALGSVLAVAGLDGRLATLPALAAWVVTVVMTAVLALDSVAGRALATSAALVAAAFAIASPVPRLIGNDVMLDIPGAAFSALSLFAFGRAIRRLPAPAPWRLLGLCLTLLFLTKYNYWLLCVLALVVTAATLVADSRAARERAREPARFGLELAKSAIRSPVFLIGLGVCALALGIAIRGPSSLDLFGQEVSLYPPSNIVTAGYAFCLAGVLVAIRARRAEIGGRIEPWTRSLAKWHLLPVALWLLLPDRVVNFIWFIGPTHYAEGTIAGYSNILSGVDFYWSTYAAGYQAFPAASWLAAGGLLASMLLIPRLTATGRAVLVFAIVCVVLVTIHPQRQPRFLAHWIFAVWICAGLGLSWLASFIFAGPARRMLVPLAVVASAGLCALALTRPLTAVQLSSAHRPMAGRPPDIELIHAYLERMEPGAPHALLASFGSASLARWPPQAACNCAVAVAQPFYSGDRARDPTTISSFLATTGMDTVVVLHIRGYPYHPGPAAVDERSRAIRAALAEQATFAREEDITVPGHGEAELAIWRRKPAPG